ncbi:MAG: magnesium chelatase, partial [Actinomycetota bacterium]|nr:magnesium chelatase [Actinomycetota bacterium]
RIVKTAVLAVFKERVPVGRFAAVLAEFDGGTVVHVGDDVRSASYVEVLERLPALGAVAVPLAGGETPAAVASAVELVLEGLHLSRRLNKDASRGSRAIYRGRG